VIEREALAMISALKHFNHYIYGRKIIIQTDHAPLQWLHTHKDQSSRLLRWALKLQDYDIQIQYKPGKINTNADALSRRTDSTNLTLSIITAVPQTDTLLHAQQQDNDCQAITNFLKNAIMKKEASKVWKKHVKQQATHYEWKDKILHHRSAAGTVPVIPKQYREQLLIQYHDAHFGGHLSAPKVFQRIRCKYYWPSMKDDIHKWCQQCELCAARKRPRRYEKAPLCPIKAKGPFERIAMDVLGPLPKTLSGNRYILVCVDLFTKWVEAFAMPDQTADTIARLLVEEIIIRYGPPSEVLTDRGANFLSSTMEAVWKIFSIHKINTSPYHPQGDGQTERMNSSLLKMLACYTASNQQDWDLHLPYCLFAYRCAEHSTTKFSPFTLLFGREPQLPIDKQWDTTDVQYMDEATYKDHLSNFLQQAWQAARENIEHSQEGYKQQYDKTARPHPFQENDLVLVHTPQPKKGLTPKLQRLWQGPYRILKTTPQDVLLEPIKKKKKTAQWIHVNRIKKAPPQPMQTFEPSRDNDHPPIQPTNQPDENVPQPTPRKKKRDSEIVTEHTENLSEMKAEPLQRQQDQQPPTIEHRSAFNLRSRSIPKIYAFIATLLLTSNTAHAILITPASRLLKMDQSLTIHCQAEWTSESQIQ
jgi:hypothetical protein